MQIQKIAGKFVPFLQKTGISGKVHLGEKRIGLLLKLGGSNQEVKNLKALLGNLEKPSMDISLKGKSNYAIASLQVKDGKDVVGHTAVSVVNVGSKNPIVKARASLGKGSDTLYANGFLDPGQPTNNRDVGHFRMKGGNVEVAYTNSKEGGRFQMNGDKLQDLAKKLPDGDKIVSNYNKEQCSFQQNYDLLEKFLNRFGLL